MADQPPEPQPEPDELDDVADAVALRRAAASRRKALRAAERERDALQERVACYERAEVARLARERPADADDLLLAVNLDDLRTTRAP